MPLRVGPRRVVAPDGVQWRIGRRWLTRRVRVGRPGRGEIASESLMQVGPALPDLASLDLGEGLLVIAAVVAVALVLIPILFFGIELVIVGALLASAVIGHTLLGQPWIVEARSTDAESFARLLEWRVRGWRQSGKLISRIAADLSAGHDPRAVELPQ
jgi:hypothetical protein